VTDDIEKLKARITREKNARKQAEHILEQKSVELFHSNSELKILTKNLEARVDERTAELQLAHDKAIKLAEVKSEFLANMSHELRTPLNGVLGMITLLQNTNMSAKQNKLVHTALNSGELLLALINDVLDLSKLENNKLVLESIPFQPTQLVQFTCEPFASQAVAKHVDLIYLIATDMPIALYGDPTRIKQIITNIVSNALKFTDKGEVLISVNYTNDTYTISVSDTGIGMTPEQLEKVLDKFTQANESTTRNFGGTGLGLAICQKLISTMEGKLSIKSELGKGSHFEVSLPLKSTDADTKLIYPAELSNKKVLIAFNNLHILHHVAAVLHHWHIQSISKATNFNECKNLLTEFDNYDLIIFDYRINASHNSLLSLVGNTQKNYQIITYWQEGTSIINEQNHQMLTLPVKQSELFDAIVQKPNSHLINNLVKNILPTKIQFVDAQILLTEDNLVNQEVAKELLLLFGCKVTIANNGVEAVDLVQKIDFDLVLMDIQMPVMDGITAVKKIRQFNLEKFKTLPIIALTAHSLQGDRDKSIEAGMDDHITKPIELNELTKILSKFLTDKKTPVSINNPRIDTHIQINNESENIKTTGVEYPGLDISGAMARLLNNLDLYLKVLKTFVSSTTQNITELQIENIKNDREPIIRAAHTIKGSAANIGANNVAAVASKLESLLKEHQEFTPEHSSQYSQILSNLEIESNIVFSSIDDFLTKNNTNIENVELPAQTIIELCKKIKNSLYSDIAEVDIHIKTLESAETPQLSLAIQKLTSGYQTFNYNLIEQGCEEIISKVKT
jgi:signal transduction histidine kinase/CheY-like chemotaxis protein/HPt (histidine-containing phosphotransfer) domain-containing protein